LSFSEFFGHSWRWEDNKTWRTLSLRRPRQRLQRQIELAGELLDDVGRRSATVIAESPLRVFGLTAWQFTPLLEQHPSIAVKVAKMLARRLREAEERAATTT
jgi:CRP-like cAMP-binding protein